MKFRVMLGSLAALTMSVAAFSLPTQEASAHVWESKTFNDLVGSSAACVKATVDEVRYVTINGATYTDTFFNVEGRAFGPVRNGRIRVRTEGGMVQTATIPVVEVGSSGAQFLQGQSAILFLGRVGRTKTFTLLHGGQGVYKVADGMVNLPISHHAMDANDALTTIGNLRRQRAKNDAQ